MAAIRTDLPAGFDLHERGRNLPAERGRPELRALDPAAGNADAFFRDARDRQLARLNTRAAEAGLTGGGEAEGKNATPRLASTLDTVRSSAARPKAETRYPSSEDRLRDNFPGDNFPASEDRLRDNFPKAVWWRRGRWPMPRAAG